LFRSIYLRLNRFWFEVSGLQTSFGLKLQTRIFKGPSASSQQRICSAIIPARRRRMRNILLVLAKRLLLVLPVVWAVVTLVFLLIHIVPGDPVRNALGDNATEAQVNELKHKLGLDLPLAQQYANYWRGVLQGDLGVSLANPSDAV